jgi:hypothetical protein
LAWEGKASLAGEAVSGSSEAQRGTANLVAHSRRAAVGQRPPVGGQEEDREHAGEEQAAAQGIEPGGAGDHDRHHPGGDLALLAGQEVEHLLGDVAAVEREDGQQVHELGPFTEHRSSTKGLVGRRRLEVRHQARRVATRCLRPSRRPGW